MNRISSEILALSSEPALMARHSRVLYANAAAMQILGSGCQDKPLKELIGPALSETQAPSFIIDQAINGQHYAVRVNHMEDCQIIFLRRCGSAPLLLNDALIYSMRNALMNFSISADMLRAQAEDRGDEALLKGLRSITHCYYRMMRVLTNASLVLSVTDGSAPFTPDEMDMALFLSRHLDTVNMLFPEIDFSLSHGEIHPIVADKQLVELMVLNLISNCIIHAKGCTRVRLNLTETRENLVFSLDDDGCGIAPEQLGTVFDRYCHGFAMDNMLSGAGLGLTVARSVAQLHHGTLLLESRQGRGTTVRVSLSRHLTSGPLHSGHDAWESSMQGILSALADCLPDDCFTENYLD